MADVRPLKLQDAGGGVGQLREFADADSIPSSLLAANLNALAGLAGAADRMPYFTGAGALSLATLTAQARTLLAAADTTAQRSALAVASPTDPYRYLPTLDLNFVSGSLLAGVTREQFTRAPDKAGISNILTFTRASGGGRFNSAGVYEWLASDQMRIDYDPSTLACRGLLIEEQRTNLLTYSADFAASAWSKSGACVVTPDQAIAPDGSATADLVTGAVDVTAGAGNNVYRAVTVTASASLTSSVWVKAVTATTVTLRHRSGSGASIGSGAFALTGAWQRIVLTNTQDANTAMTLLIGAADGTFYMWGAQMEQGASATSYIPTTSAQVTRAEDVAMINALPPWYRQEGSTVFVEFTQETYVGTRGPFWVNDGTSFRGIGIYYYAAGLVNGRYRAVDDSSITSPTTAVNGGALTNKLTMAFSKNRVAVSANGGAAVSTSGSVSAATVDRLRLGYCAAGGASVGALNGHVRRFRCYPAEFTDAELKELSAA